MLGEDRRLALVQVCPELVVNWAVGSAIVVDRGDVPDGAVVKGVSFDAPANVFLVILEHESFAHVHVGEKIPVLKAQAWRRTEG